MRAELARWLGRDDVATEQWLLPRDDRRAHARVRRDVPGHGAAVMRRDPRPRLTGPALNEPVRTARSAGDIAVFRTGSSLEAR